MKWVVGLEKYCEMEDFHIEINGNIYCNVGLTRNVECKYQSKIKDKNGLYPCLNLKYNHQEKPSLTN